MKKDIIVAGVGGQGIITVAVLIAEAALAEGLNFRQSEVHGMSQRGGAVQSHVRLSDSAIHGDTIPLGRADLLVSLEPLEALRYIDYLKPGAAVIANALPVKNIPDYPAMEVVLKKLSSCGRKVFFVDAQKAAEAAGNARTQNVAMAGAAGAFIGLKKESYAAAMEKMFGLKGRVVVEMNTKAFELGSGGLSELA